MKRGDGQIHVHILNGFRNVDRFDLIVKMNERSIGTRRNSRYSCTFSFHSSHNTFRIISFTSTKSSFTSLSVKCSDLSPKVSLPTTIRRRRFRTNVFLKALALKFPSNIALSPTQESYLRKFESIRSRFCLKFWTI